MNVQEMMKQDANSVIGLNVSYDFGGTKPLVGIIGAARIKDYSWTIDGEQHITQRYHIAINSDCCFYEVDKFQTAHYDFDKLFAENTRS